MKKVLFVSDFGLDTAPGGAQISNAAIVKKGRELGYEIVEHFYLQDRKNKLYFKKSKSYKVRT